MTSHTHTSHVKNLSIFFSTFPLVKSILFARNMHTHYDVYYETPTESLWNYIVSISSLAHIGFFNNLKLMVIKEPLVHGEWRTTSRNF